MSIRNTLSHKGGKGKRRRSMKAPAKNRHSNSCSGFTTKLDTYLAENQIYVRSASVISTERKLLFEEDIVSDESWDNYTRDFTDGPFRGITRDELKQLFDSLGKILHYNVNLMSAEQINEYLPDKFKVTVNENDDFDIEAQAQLQTMLGNIATILRNFETELFQTEAVFTEMAMRGESNLSKLELNVRFRETIPLHLQNEVKSEALHAIIRAISDVLEDPQYSGMSIEELITKYGISPFIKSAFISMRTAYINNFFNKSYNYSRSQKLLYDRMFHIGIKDTDDAQIWSYVVAQCKTELIKSLRIKIDDTGIEDLSKEDFYTESDEEAEGRAEETGPEHWMVKAEMVNSYLSLSADVKRLLYLLPQTTTGPFGIPNFHDIMFIHKRLLYIRSKFGCTNSSDFMQSIADYKSKDNKISGEDWYNILKKAFDKNPYLQTRFFRSYRKAVLNYCAYNVNRTKHWVRRSTNSLTDKQILNQYKESYLVVRDPENCVFANKTGVFDGVKVERALRSLLGSDIMDNIVNTVFTQDGIRNLEALKKQLEHATKQDFVQSYLKSQGIYSESPENEDSVTRAARKEQQVEKAKLILNAFNIPYSKGDIENISDGEFAYYFDLGVTMLFRAYEAYKSNRIETIKSTISRMEAGTLRPLLEHSTEQVIKSFTPDDGFRFQKGSYFVHTTSNFLMDTLEKINKVASRKQDRIRISEYLNELFGTFTEEDNEVCFFDLDCLINSRIENGEEVEKYTNPLLQRLYDISLIGESDTLSEEEAAEVNRICSTLRILGTDDTEFRKLSEGKDILIHYLEYKFATVSSKGKYCVVPTFITGDSNSTRTFTVPYQEAAQSITTIKNAIFMELVRMAETDFMIEAGVDNRAIAAHSREFCYFPFMNELLTKEQISNFVNQIKQHFSKSEEDITALKQLKTEFFDFVRNNEDSKNIAQHIEEQLNSQFDAFINRLVSEEILVNNNGQYIFSNNIIVPEDGFEDANLEDLRNFFFNYKVGMFSQLQLLTVDPSFYDNSNDAQKRFKQIIAAGDPLDMSAIDPDTKNFLFSENNDGVVEYKKQRGLYVADIRVGLDDEEISERDKPFREALKECDPTGEVLKPYTKKDGNKGSTMTDGQVWRSFTSYRKIMIGKGTWSEECEAVWNIIQKYREESKNLSEEDRKQAYLDMRKAVASYNLCFQPIKSYWYGFETVEVEANGVKIQKKIPVQVKCSEYPIIPELLPLEIEPGKPNNLVKLGQFMERNDIDFIASNTTIKVGMHHVATFEEILENNAAQEQTEGVAFALDDKVHELPWEHWREQSNQPEHIDVARAKGTQFQKHALEGLAEVVTPRKYHCLEKLAKEGKINLGYGEKADIETTKDPGIEIMKVFNVLLGVGYLKSAKQLCKKLGTPKARSKSLVKKALVDTRRKADGIEGYSLDEDDGEFVMSPAEGQDAQDNMAGMISDFKKDVIKQRMKGGSAIQVSSYGFDDILGVHVEEVNTANGKRHNVVYADCVKTFDFSVTIDGKQVKLNYFDYVDPITGMPLDEEGNPVEPLDAVKDENGNLIEGKDYYGWNTKLGKHYPGIFDIIAYRIPTEKTYSVINLKIKRFLPKTAGAVIIVPTHFTTVAGFDFDIDKLYFVRREFEFKREVDPSNLNSEENKKIWTNIYKTFGKVVAERIDQIIERRKQVLNTTNANLIARRNALLPTEKELPSTAYPTRITEPYDIVKDEADGKFYIRTPKFDKDNKPIVNDAGEQQYFVRESTEEELRRWSEVRAYNEKVDEYEQAAADYRRTNESAKYSLWEQAVSELKNEQPQNTAIQALPNTSNDAFLMELEKPGYKYLFLECLSNYDSSKPISQYTQAQRNNLLFDLYQARLEDLDTMKDRFNPGGYRNLQNKKALMLTLRYASKEDLKNIRTIRELRELSDRLNKEGKLDLNYDYLDPFTLTHYHVYNSLYDDLIGIAANQSLNQTLVALCKEFSLKVPIGFGSMVTTTALGTYNDVGRNIKKRYIRGIDTETQCTEFLTGAVDAVKDAVIEFFGVDVNNFNLAVFTTRVGANVEDIGMLFNQPICMLAASRMRRGDSSSFSDALKKEFFKLIRNIKDTNTRKELRKYLEQSESYQQEVLKEKYGDISKRLSSSLDTDSLLSNVLSFMNMTEAGDNYLDCLTKINSINKNTDAFVSFLKKQIDVIIMMERLEKLATKMSDQVNIAKTTSLNTVKSEYGDWLSLRDRCNTVISKLMDPDGEFEIVLSDNKSVSTIVDPNVVINPFNDSEGFNAVWSILVNSPYGIEQAAYTAMFTYATYVIDMIFPYTSETFEAMRGYINNICGKTHGSGALYNKLNKAFTAFLMAKFLSFFDPNRTVTIYKEDGSKYENPPTAKEFYTKFFPNYLSKMLRANQRAIREYRKNGNTTYKTVIDYSQFAIFKMFAPKALSVNEANAATNKKMEFSFVGNLTHTSKEDLTFELRQMLTSTDKILRSLALHMILYSFHYSGVTWSRGSIFGLTPLSAKLNNFNGTEDNPQDSYRDFFNTMANLREFEGLIQTGSARGILTGSVPIKDFLMSFIVDNYSEFYQFRKYIDDDLAKLIAVANNSTEENFNAFFGLHNTFTLTIDNFESEKSLCNLATHIDRDENYNIIAATVPPIIIIGKEAFICDKNLTSDEVSFNTMYPGEKITYYKILNNRFGLTFNRPSVESHSSTFILGEEGIQTVGGYFTISPDSTNEDYNPNEDPNDVIDEVIYSVHGLKTLILSSLNTVALETEKMRSLYQTLIGRINELLKDPKSYHTTRQQLVWIKQNLIKVQSVVESIQINENAFLETMSDILSNPDTKSVAINTVIEHIRNQKEMVEMLNSEIYRTITSKFINITEKLIAPGVLIDGKKIVELDNILMDIKFFTNKLTSRVIGHYNDYGVTKIKKAIEMYNLLAQERAIMRQRMELNSSDISEYVNQMISTANDMLQQQTQNSGDISTLNNILNTLRHLNRNNKSQMLRQIGMVQVYANMLSDNTTGSIILQNANNMRTALSASTTLEEIAKNPEEKQNICTE